VQQSGESLLDTGKIPDGQEGEVKKSGWKIRAQFGVRQLAAALPSCELARWLPQLLSVCGTKQGRQAGLKESGSKLPLSKSGDRALPKRMARATGSRLPPVVAARLLRHDFG
jgi:hypothetical protein